ncbi:uncharacterized protein TNCV_1819191 [Trichonephila clavipes]|nr:uncharacterized protein TNCV_1819191 [Trichonephila clavipes]
MTKTESSFSVDQQRVSLEHVSYLSPVKVEVKVPMRECNNRIIMAQRKHLDDFLRGEIIGRLECGHTQMEVSEELGIAQSVISRLWQ